MFQSLLSNTVAEVENGILSCLPAAERASDYDAKVNAYDRVVGNAIYNRLIWGNWPSNYATFCRDALASRKDGSYLDAGCGSLVFTAETYARADNRLVVLLDRSLGMLRQGRERIRRLCGEVPSNLVFLQADIFALPFHGEAFDVVASYGVLHMFDDKHALLGELERVKKASGAVFFSSLVAENWLGRKYLGILRNAGEVATAHSSESLRDLLGELPYGYSLNAVGNMAYGRTR